jgi:small nuclear ribonucleoprotein G
MCAAPFPLGRSQQLTCAQVFLNIVLDDAVEEKDNGEKAKLGMVVIRGNSVVMLEALERIGGDDRRER